VIDADVLARAGEVFDLVPLRVPAPGQLALRRVCTRRGAAVIDGNCHLRRLISLARWAFPDVWNGFAGSLATAKAVLYSWPHLAQLAARRATLTAVVAEHTRDVPDVPARAEAIRDAAGAWVRFWTGRMDLDELASAVSEHLADLEVAAGRIDRATALATQYWERLYGDDPLLASLPGLGSVTTPTIRAFLADGTTFNSAKHAASYVGLAPSNWSSGTVTQPSRAITKEGPRGAAAGVLPSGQRRPPCRPATGRDLPPADGHLRALPHPGHRRSSPQTGRTDLDRARPRPALPTARSRRATHHRLGSEDADHRAVHRARHRPRSGRAHSAATHRAKLTR
jgi:transposase